MNEELNRELAKNKIEQETITIELKKEQERIIKLLKNGMGNDMINVINGKSKVKLTFMENMKYKFQKIIKKIFKTI